MFLKQMTYFKDKSFLQKPGVFALINEIDIEDSFIRFRTDLLYSYIDSINCLSCLMQLLVLVVSVLLYNFGYHLNVFQVLSNDLVLIYAH